MENLLLFEMQQPAAVQKRKTSCTVRNEFGRRGSFHQIPGTTNRRRPYLLNCGQKMQCPKCLPPCEHGPLLRFPPRRRVRAEVGFSPGREHDLVGSIQEMQAL